MIEIPIFVISLDRRSQRFQRIESELAGHGLSARFVKGLDGGRKASLIRRISRRDFFSEKHNRQLSPGEVGCFVSHVRALRMIVNGSIPKALILEDDATFDEAFGDFYRADLSNLLDVADVVKLEGHVYPHTSRRGVRIFRGRTCDAIVPLRPSLCAAAYAVTLRGAKHVEAVANRVSEPFDFIVHGYERYNARYCEIRPLLVEQSGVPSIIGDEGRSGDFASARESTLMAPAADYAYKVMWRLANIAQTIMIYCFAGIL